MSINSNDSGDSGKTSSDRQADSQADAEADNDQLICFCHTVTRGQIRAAIRAGATTIEKIQSDTCASTGCGGCECDVRDILDAEIGASDASAGTPGAAGSRVTKSGT
jgi:NAD(P)H-nitrite reductase large subunit